MRSIWNSILNFAVVSAAALLVTSAAVEAQRGKVLTPPPSKPPPPRISPEFNKTATEVSPRGAAASPGSYTRPVDNLGHGRLLNPQPIKASTQRLEKVRNQHMEGGSSTKRHDGRFYRGTDVKSLIKKAETRPAYWQQKTGNYLRIVRMDRKIGTWVPNKASANREPTNLYTVVTDANNNLVSLFPGLPRVNHLSK